MAADLWTPEEGKAKLALIEAALAKLGNRGTPDAAPRPAEGARLIRLARQFFTPKGFQERLATAPRAFVRELMTGLIVGGTVERHPDAIRVPITVRLPAGLLSEMGKGCPTASPGRPGPSSISP